MRTAMVTGSSGYLGSHVCKLLKANDWKVIGYDTVEPKHSYVDMYIQDDIRNGHSVFDDNKIYIDVYPNLVNDKLISFHQSINLKEDFTKIFKTRKEAELFAIAEAFKLLEEKITPIEFPNIEDEAVIND